MVDRRNTIIIVDDQEVNRVILRGAFERQYNILEAENGEQAVYLLEEYHEDIAAMLLDIIMPVMDGYKVLEEAGNRGWLSEFPIVVITAENSAEGEVRAFDLGASELITKPFELHVAKRRVQNVVDLNMHKLNQERLINAQAEKLRESNAVMIDTLSAIIEYRSLETGQHIKRIRMFTRALLEDVRSSYSEYMLSRNDINIIVSASSLHDIGKIAIPDAILNKPGRLTAEEFTIMKTHAAKGCEMLARLDRMSDRKYLRYAYDICRYHHERWDGHGYPDGLKGDSIPICAQVVGIADCYDALTNDRVYKKALPPEKAFNMILNGECGTFSPRLLESLKHVQSIFRDFTQKYADDKSAETLAVKPKMPALFTANDNLDTLQMGQMKYFTLLKYMGETVMEVDLATGLYHMVYLSTSDFELLRSGAGFIESLDNFIQQSVHPDDRMIVQQLITTDMQAMFHEGLLKKSCRCRVLNTISRAYHWCRATLMRTNIDSPHQRKALFIWQNNDSEEQLHSTQQTEVYAHMLQSVVEGAQLCRNDCRLTIEQADIGIQKLTGYTATEIADLFNNHYIKLINPSDRNDVLAQIGKQLQRGRTVELEYRLVTKSGQTVWLLSKVQSIIGENGDDYLYMMLIDITKSKQTQEELRFLAERYKIITEQTNDIIFEWDAAKDEVTYSDNYKDKLGYEPVRKHAMMEIPKKAHIHPDDIIELQGLIREMQGGKPYKEIEVRFVDKSRTYHWGKIRAVSQYDQDGRLYKVIGVVTDIDEEKRRSQEFKNQAEHDLLTMLYNKHTACQKIRNELADRQETSMAALLIIDVDNFKLINDTYGHMFGDAVLQGGASELRRVTGANDIVARIGGDEFLIFMNDISSSDDAEKFAAIVHDTFANVFSESINNCKPSCSIGIAIYPADGSNFETLFHSSDIALYTAKSRGKDTFVRFHSDMLDSVDGIMPSQLVVNTKIESESPEKDLFLSLLLMTLHELYYSQDIEAAINIVLSKVGQQLGVSRMYIFEDVAGRYCRNTFEWCNEGITPAIDTLQHIDYIREGSDYRSLFDEKGIFFCHDVSMLPDWQCQILQMQDIKSMLQCSMHDKDKYCGFIGFDDCLINRIWTKSQVEILDSLGMMISEFLQRYRAENALKHS